MGASVVSERANSLCIEQISSKRALHSGSRLYTVARVKMPFHLCALVFSLPLTGTIAVFAVWAKPIQKQLSWVVHVLTVRA